MIRSWGDLWMGISSVKHPVMDLVGRLLLKESYQLLSGYGFLVE